MLSFFRESIKEFDHVVWPTRAETSRYFSIVLSVIAVLTVFLFLIGSAFSTSLFAIREAVVPVKSVQTSASSSASSDVDLSSLLGSGSEDSTGAKAPVSDEAVPKR